MTCSKCDAPTVLKGGVCRFCIEDNGARVDIRGQVKCREDIICPDDIIRPCVREPGHDGWHDGGRR